ncbi:MAG: hypothetical protein NZV14_16730 [Bryobacteraceae bacterium]|nr:hypothetical protein [Bryobacteraceae bacterium]MDW8379807.1 hypothetical protein [Bryobacterales bacterium]
MRPDPDPQALLQRILQSPGFRQSPPHQALLQYICGLTQGGEFEALQEHDIGVRLFGLAPGYDVQAQPLVRRLTEETRELLADYFRQQGHREPLRLAIPKGEYRAFFYQASPEELDPEPLQALVQFWAPYLSVDARNYLVHGQLAGDQVSIPEAYALIKVASVFEKQHGALEIRAIESFDLGDLRGVNLILLGTADNNSLLKAALDDRPAQALVKRLAAAPFQGTVTVITGPDAESVLQAATFATSEESLARMRDRALASDFPPDFEFKIRGEI